MKHPVRRAHALRALAVALLLALGLAACGGSGTKHTTVSIATPTATTSGSSAADLEQTFVNVIRTVTPQVVQIQNPQGLGSGIVFDGSGDIVTNAHVVAGGGPYKVTTSNGHTYNAKLVGSFTPDDLAVVRVQGAGSLTPATFASMKTVQVGDLVLAIGNPLGLSSSVTNGIVSAIGRTVSEPNNVVLPDVVQTSAPINPGNSGGALVNMQGQVIGIPTLAATDPELGNSAAPGIGFAIPSSIVTDIAGQIVKSGHVTDSHRAYLGVELASELVQGAVIAQVQSGGPAAKAGLRAGDVITAINGQRIASASDVSTALATLKPGQKIKVDYDKATGGSASTTVTLGQYPGTTG